MNVCSSTRILLHVVQNRALNRVLDHLQHLSNAFTHRIPKLPSKLLRYAFAVARACRYGLCMYESVYIYYDSVSIYVKVKTLPRLNAAFAFRMFRLKSNFSHVGSECTYGQPHMYTRYNATQHRCNPKSNTLENDRPKYDNTAACVITQQYSSSTFVSLHLHFFKAKIRVPFNP